MKFLVAVVAMFFSMQASAGWLVLSDQELDSTLLSMQVRNKAATPASLTATETGSGCNVGGSFPDALSGYQVTTSNNDSGKDSVVELYFVGTAPQKGKKLTANVFAYTSDGGSGVCVEDGKVYHKYIVGPADLASSSVATDECLAKGRCEDKFGNAIIDVSGWKTGDAEPTCTGAATDSCRCFLSSTSACFAGYSMGAWHQWDGAALENAYSGNGAENAKRALALWGAHCEAQSHNGQGVASGACNNATVVALTCAGIENNGGACYAVSPSELAVKCYTLFMTSIVADGPC